MKGNHFVVSRRATVDEGRVARLNDRPPGAGPVLWWLSRDQRAADNWALLFALELARSRRVPLAAAFCLAPTFLGATLRHYDFMLRGLRELEGRLAALGVPLFLLPGQPEREIVRLAGRLEAGDVVTDFDPLRIKRRWRDEAATRLAVPLWEVDAHNVVPCRQASDRREWGAYTLRPRIRRQLDRYLTPFPPVRRPPVAWAGPAPGNDWEGALRGLDPDASVAPVAAFVPGESAARRALADFVRDRLTGYADRRNDPASDGQSGLSPWLHFGQLSPQCVALAVMGAGLPDADSEALLEELIVRRELADNFCWHCPEYDSVEAFPRWARETLAAHAGDRREHLYAEGELELGRTHDDLWNAAQWEMVRCGKMHGYLRMYWAKKILEWTPSAAAAVRVAVRLNDRYELDGRDPNGYAGIAWAIGGVHDRAWPSHPVFGKVRIMTRAGMDRKFDTAAYISLHPRGGRGPGSRRREGPSPARRGGR